MKSLKLTLIGLLLTTQLLAYGSSGNDIYTSLLCQAEGPDQSTTFSDSSIIGQTLTTNAPAKIVTAQQKFGSSSGLFDGLTAYVTAPDNSVYNMADGNFCLEAWIRFNTVTGVQGIFSQGTDGNTFMQFDCVSGTSLRFYLNGTAIGFTASVSLSANIWYHVAVVRDGNLWTIYLNGVSKGSQSSATTYTDYTGPFCFGAIDYNLAVIEYFNGWIDGVRITKGDSRFKGGFIPPVSPYCAGCEMVEGEE